MLLAATGMELEIFILSEVKSERKRQIPYNITYMWNLKYGTNKPSYKTETNRHRDQTRGCQGGDGGMDWEFGG